MQFSKRELFMKNKNLYIVLGFLLISFIIFSVFFNNSEFNCENYVKDVDGNEYRVVQIGEQCWFTENLVTTKYRNGKNILEASQHINAAGEWSGGLPAYTWLNHDYYENKKDLYVSRYGYLYNWQAVNYQREMNDLGYGICPRGWSVPTHNDWTDLERYVCESSRRDDCEHYFIKDESSEGYYGNDEGNKLKGVDFLGVEKGTDDYGFNALPGGLRYADGAFSPPNFYAAWWSSTGNGEYAWIREIYDTEKEIGRFLVEALNGHSIRCIKDK